MDFETVTADGYGFQIEMTHRLVRAGGRIVEFPIEFRDRRAGESKMSQGDRRRGPRPRRCACGSPTAAAAAPGGGRSG